MDESERQAALERLKPRQPRDLVAEHPEAPRVGGTLEIPDHPPTRFERVRGRLPRVPRPARIIAGALALFGLLNATGWVLDAVGWRQALVVVGTALLLPGVLLLRYARPSDEFVEGVQRLQRRGGRRVVEREELRGAHMFWYILGGGTLTALALLSFAVAAWA